MIYFRQSTAGQIVAFGPFVDVTDGVTLEVALAIAVGEVSIHKYNATSVVAKNSGGGTYMAGGIYRLTFDAVDTDTLGPGLIVINDTAALPVIREFLVLPAMIYDSLIAGTDVLQVDATQWNGSNVATPDTAGHPKVTVKDGTGTGEIDLVAGMVQLSFAQALPGSPTADTVGDAFKQATREEAPKKNVALSDIPFYMVSATDHVTPVTGATVAAQVSKEGAAFGAGAGTVTEIGSGAYGYDATAADMNGDALLFKFTATGADPVLIAIATVD